MLKKQQQQQNAAAVSSSSSSSAPTSQNNNNNDNNTSSSSLNKAEKDELIALRAEVAEYEVEFRNLKNQDITIRKLEGKIVNLQESQAQTVADQVNKAQQSWQASHAEILQQALMEQDRLATQVSTLRLELQTERAGLAIRDQEWLAMDGQAQAMEAAWEAQRSLLLSDAERLRQDLQMVTRQRDELQVQVAINSSSSSANNSANAAAASRMSSSGSTGTTPASGNSVVMAEMVLERKAYEAEVSRLLLLLLLLLLFVNKKKSVSWR